MLARNLSTFECVGASVQSVGVKLHSFSENNNFWSYEVLGKPTPWLEGSHFYDIENMDWLTKSGVLNEIY